MAVFIIRAGEAIPLHSHPSMVVYSKMLFGEMSEYVSEPLPVVSAFLVA
jgi:hypothetical protein